MTMHLSSMTIPEAVKMPYKEWTEKLWMDRGSRWKCLEKEADTLRSSRSELRDGEDLRHEMHASTVGG